MGESSRKEALATLLFLGVLVLCAIGLFMTIGAGEPWDFVLAFRGRKVLTMLLVGYCVAVSTVLFQTLTENKILTPALMGFDSLYILIQTTLMFVLGISRIHAIDAKWMFLIHVGLMMLLAIVLNRWFLSGMRRGLELMVLSGVVLGVLFRSIAGFMQRLIDPNEFAFLQDRFFASFNNPEQDLLAVSVVLTVGASVIGLRHLHRLDVMLLGHDVAINLGIDYQRMVSRILLVVAVLVSVSTALVGPVMFFGLLVANLAYVLLPTFRHGYVLAGATLLAALCLIGGQVFLEQVFSFDTNLRVIIEFLGGLVFIAMLVKGATRQ